jgi:hypothetical protein
MNIKIKNLLVAAFLFVVMAAPIVLADCSAGSGCLTMV